MTYKIEITEKIIDKTIYILEGHAHNGTLITYGQLYEQIGIDRESPSERNRGARILEEVSKKTVPENGTMLSAIVVLQYEEIPEKGFFNLAIRMEKFHKNYTDEEKIDFFKQEKKKVFNFYKR